MSPFSLCTTSKLLFPFLPPPPISLLPELNSVPSLVWLITAVYLESLSVVLAIFHSQTGLQPEELSLGLCRTIAISPTAMLLHTFRHPILSNNKVICKLSITLRQNVSSQRHKMAVPSPFSPAGDPQFQGGLLMRAGSAAQAVGLGGAICY